MKKVWIPAVIMSLFCFQAAFGDELGFKYDSKTGDKELDLSLGKLNIEAKADMSNFIKDLSVSYGLPEKNVELMVTRDNMQPADVYMSVRLSNMTKRPLDTVVQEFRVNRGKGWGVIAKNLGIKPGSREFHALKKGDFRVRHEGPEDKGHKKEKGHKGKGKDKD